jgi:hypothetical protein
LLLLPGFIDALRDAQTAPDTLRLIETAEKSLIGS